MKELKIDWTNHVIAFISSLLGILIAFQLQDWQENRSENERMKITLKAIKREIESNLKIYQINSDSISQWLDYCNFCLTHKQQGIRGMILTEKAFDSFRAKNINRLEGARLLKKYNDSLNVYDAPISVDVSPETGISTNNWEAAKSSGVLNNIDHTRMAILTQIYYWTDIDLGGNEADLKRLIIKKGEFDNLTEVMDVYKQIAVVSKVKKTKIEENFRQIDWK